MMNIKYTSHMKHLAVSYIDTQLHCFTLTCNNWKAIYTKYSHSYNRHIFKWGGGLLTDTEPLKLQNLTVDVLYIPWPHRHIFAPGCSTLKCFPEQYFLWSKHLCYPHHGSHHALQMMTAFYKVWFLSVCIFFSPMLYLAFCMWCGFGQPRYFKPPKSVLCIQNSWIKNYYSNEQDRPITLDMSLQGVECFSLEFILHL